jgi:hypothetical protein
MIATDDPDPDSERPGDFSQPVGQGQGRPDPNAAARQRAQQERQNAAAAGVTPPPNQGTADEKRVAHSMWVSEQLKNPALTLERLAYVHMITGQRQMLGYDAGGVPLGKRIAAELARFGADPNGPMPTPEQARAAGGAQ